MSLLSSNFQLFYRESKCGLLKEKGNKRQNEYDMTTNILYKFIYISISLPIYIVEYVITGSADTSKGRAAPGILAKVSSVNSWV